LPDQAVAIHDSGNKKTTVCKNPMGLSKYFVSVVQKANGCHHQDQIKLVIIKWKIFSDAGQDIYLIPLLRAISRMCTEGSNPVVIPKGSANLPVPTPTSNPRLFSGNRDLTARNSAS
jgi:hypothetical protein